MKESLQSQMLQDSLIIFKSIEWIEKEIDKKLIELDKISINNLEDFKILESQILVLVRKLSIEEDNMDKYMIKYRKLVNEEKLKNL
jgi:hypothetical protein